NIGKQKNFDLRAICTKSLNQTLSRTILTSCSTMAVIITLLLLGGGVIQLFALTMLVGIVTGTYSSIFIAVPLVIYLHERERAAEKTI
ncbi:MAG: protein translocase subunit SecDF, partial [Planctomycetes bacterium]|nr:protein translocase subunit SecDF [Planctomycetota bacterium]